MFNAAQIGYRTDFNTTDENMAVCAKRLALHDSIRSNTLDLQSLECSVTYAHIANIHTLTHTPHIDMYMCMHAQNVYQYLLDV